MKEFFEKVMSENKKYREMVELGDEAQLEQLEKCSTLMEAIRICGWTNEYANYIKDIKF